MPKGWVEPAQAVVSWQSAVSADGPLRYTVVVDGRRQPAPPGATRLRLDTRAEPGTHSVQLLATDIDGESTLSSPSTLKIAGPPSINITRLRGDHGVSVQVSDPYSAVDTREVIVSFGDGRSARGHKHFAHRYAHAGIYRVIVHARDKLGETGVVSRWVKVS